MFTPFLYHLRDYGLKVATQEWQVLLKALERGHGGESLTKFYYLARAICCRSEFDFDVFDRAFSSFFEGIESATTPHGELPPELAAWLKNPSLKRSLTVEESAMLKALEFRELNKQFLERLKEQKERHDGGSHWVGTGGTSPFGHHGFNPAGIRVGGEGVQRSAVQIAERREFKNYRSDLTLDTRQIGVALRKLRHWVREGHAQELDLEGTIEATGKNAGEIDLVFRSELENNLKLLLLMDVGGSMTDHARVCEQLFSAAHQGSHFKQFRPYFFHNCPYDHLYLDLEQGQSVPTLSVLRELDRSWMLIVVGDAAMSPYELTEVGGAIDYFERNQEPGLVWLARLRQHFPCSVWLNPEPVGFWQRPSNQLVRRVFKDMYPLSLEGLDGAIAHLKKAKASGLA